MGQTRHTEVNRKPAGHQNGSSVPDWLAAAGIGPTEYITVTKPQLKFLQRPYYTLKLQVWATVILHTAGYKGEEAFTMRNGLRIPLTSAHIVSELHAAAKEYYTAEGIAMSPQQAASLREDKETVRKILAELEEDVSRKEFDRWDTRKMAPPTAIQISPR